MNDSSQLIERIEKAKNGSEDVREELLQEYLPFILSCVSDFTGRYIEVGRSEELTVALLAMNESIDSYDADRGTLVALTRTNIRNRLTDMKRKETSAAVPIDDELLKNIGSAQALEDESILRQEIETFKQVLKEYNIELEGLVDECPRHRDTIRELKELARNIAQDDFIVHEMQMKKSLPVRLIRKSHDVSAKVLRSHKSYLIALVLANRSNSDTIRYYVRLKEVK